jgi:putative ABC transport system permease protein
MNSTLDPDLFVLPSQRLDIQTVRFPATMGPELAALPSVAQVQMERDCRIAFRKGTVMIVALEASSLAQTDRRRPVAGEPEEMYRKLAAGQGVIVSDNFAQLKGLKFGETLEIPAPYGLIKTPIVGIMVDYSDQQGAILMDRALFIKHWHDDSVNVFRIYGERGVPLSEVRRQIVERYAGRRQAFVLTNTDVKNYIMQIVDQWFGLTSVQIAVAVLVAILGIINTLTVSITDRRRQLAVLQAVGAVRSQVRRAIWIEALAVGTIGLVLGCALGSINLYYMLQVVQRDIAGMRLDYEFPFTTALGLVPIILSAAFLSAVWPAESAVRGSLVEALEYE